MSIPNIKEVRETTTKAFDNYLTTHVTNLYNDVSLSILGAAQEGCCTTYLDVINYSSILIDKIIKELESEGYSIRLGNDRLHIGWKV